MFAADYTIAIVVGAKYDSIWHIEYIDKVKNYKPNRWSDLNHRSEIKNLPLKFSVDDSFFKSIVNTLEYS